MSNSVIVALISLFGTLSGSFAGIIASGKLTSFRLSALEKKVDDLGELAKQIAVIQSEQKSISSRLYAAEHRHRAASVSN